MKIPTLKFLLPSQLQINVKTCIKHTFLTKKIIQKSFFTDLPILFFSYRYRKQTFFLSRPYTNTHRQHVRKNKPKPISMTYVAFESKPLHSVVSSSTPRKQGGNRACGRVLCPTYQSIKRRNFMSALYMPVWNWKG